MTAMPVTEVMVSMRDGIRLQSFVRLPKGEGPSPSLMVRCMYGTDGLARRAEMFVEEGYAVVAQNVRGRHKSEGGPTGRGDFAEDGFDTLEWMVAQSWCNGRLALSAPRLWRGCRQPPLFWAIRPTGRCVRRCCPTA